MTVELQGSQRLKQVAMRSAQPLSALLELTYVCNWRCVFCYNPRHVDLRGLSGAEWIAVLDGLRALGTLTVTLTGGEPLLHREFFEIAGAARARGFALRIFTTGSLVDDSAAERIAALHPMGVELSLHGATADVHDRTTGKPGSFEAMWRGVDALRRCGVRLLLKTPLSRLNEHQLDEMMALATERDIPYQVDPNLVPRDDGDRSPLDYVVSREALARLLKHDLLRRTLAEEKRELGGANCGIGRITVAVDPEGNVFPCPEWRHQSLGNVRTAPIAGLWRESEVRRRAAATGDAANDRLLAAGGPLASFPFCPALAFQATGDPLTPDAFAVARATLAAEARAAGD